MTRRGALLFVALGIIWGIPYLFIRLAVAELSPPVIVLGRCVIGALVLLPFALRSGDLRAVLRRWPLVLAYAGVEIMLAWWLLTDAERHITSSLAGLLVAATPIFATVLALALRIDRRVSPLRVTGLLVGLGGVAALAGVDAAGGAPLRPVLQVLATALCYAIGPMIIARRLGGVSPVAVNAVALSLAAIVYAPFAVASWPTSTPSGGVIGSVVLLGLVPTALAFVLLFQLIAEVGPAPATVITYLNQAVALLAGVVFLSEPVTTGIVVGFPLVLVGAFLATWRPRRARVAEPAARAG
ncbi:DMT family transporter [Xylanimonas protaetiae]|uniref:DMT family transporter n=1 Tax=Xylanimonas protaetiae TaxID=2509457 RepID=A0A4P6F682_9MICO|nr:DMT family transporter [Xylanimonas protaetiae]QAY71252.1 DMT family transporter [Xylanimonas protaetiae]